MSRANPLVFLVLVSVVGAVGVLVPALVQFTRVLDTSVVPIFEVFFERKEIPYVVVFISILFSYVVSSTVAKVILATDDGFDNEYPRAQRAQLTPGLTARAFAAHENLVESIPLIVTGVLFAQVRKASLAFRIRFSLLFLIARVIYYFAYLSNLDAIRSLLWGVSFGSASLLVLAGTIDKFDAVFNDFSNALGAATIGKLL